MMLLTMVSLDLTEFPELNSAQVNSRPVWNKPDTGLFHSNLKKEINELVDAIKVLSETVIRIEKNLNELNNRIEIQDKRTTIHGISITAVIDTLHLMAKWVHANNKERPEVKRKINKSTEELLAWKQKLNWNKINELIPPVSSPQPNTSINNVTNNNNLGEAETNDDHSMISPGEDG